MDPTERLITQIIRNLVEKGVLVKIAHSGYVLAYGFSSAVGQTVQYLLKLLFSAGRRILSAIRQRSPDDSIVGVIFQEIVAMGSESVDLIIDSVIAIIAFLKTLLNMTCDVMECFVERGVSFTERLGQRSLDFCFLSQKNSINSSSSQDRWVV